MTDSRYPYSCHKARKELGQVFTLLAEAGALAESVSEGWLHSMVAICGQCEKDLGAKHCTGWSVEIRAEAPLVFELAEFERRLVQPRMYAKCSYARSTGAKGDEWERYPMAASNVVVSLFVDGNDHQPAERHHIDLAGSRQAGTVWHLQAGGNPTGFDKFGTTWLKVPRWAMAPVDVTLMSEALVFNFYPAAWKQLSGDGRWIHLIQRAEDLLLRHYHDHLQAYFMRGGAAKREGTWLLAQDNLGGWNPRPA